MHHTHTLTRRAHVTEVPRLRVVPEVPPAVPAQPAAALPALLAGVNDAWTRGTARDRDAALDHAQMAVAEVAMTLAALRQALA